MSNLFLFDLFADDPPQVETPAPAITQEVSGTLPDASERARALDIRHSWIVEAPAGSGKTGLLIQRYLRLLADESVTAPAQVLAITFTRKATAELRERVLTQLHAAAANEPPRDGFDAATRPLALSALERDRALHWQLLDQPGRLNIRTIDSVCANIANSLPVLSASGGSRTITQNTAPLYAAAAHRTFLQLGGPDAVLDHALRLLLLHRDGNLAECERLLAQMLENRDQWGRLVPVGAHIDDTYLDSTVLPKLERALEQTICSALTHLARTIPADLLDDLTTAAAEMAHLEGHGGAPSPIAICSGRYQSPQDRADDLAHWRALIHLLLTASTKSWRKGFAVSSLGFRIPLYDKQRLEGLIEQLQQHDDLLPAICKIGTLPPAQYPPEQWTVAKALFRILNRALAELQLLFAERSECDYAEVALAARTALQSPGGPHDLEAALGSTLQHILVDEMQDTSSSQYELVQMLTAHFDGHSQTVFLVGDPKQSIYLFRQARVQRFLRSMASERLGDLPLGHLRLIANFRSQAGLVDGINHDFGRIFPSQPSIEHPEEVLFVAACAIRPPDATMAGRLWRPTILPYVKSGERSPDKQRYRVAGARDIRDIVSSWRARPLPADRREPWKIAILVRSRAHLSKIVETLKNAALGPPIPFRAVEIEPLKERPEVQDLFALTRALLHPADRTAWLAILRAPWCGLTLADLHTLTGADDPAFAERSLHSLIAERGELLAPEAVHRLERLWPVLEAASALRSRAPLSQIVERTWRSLGGDVFLTPPELANARTYLQLLAELEAQRPALDLATLAARLEKLFAAPVLDPAAIDIMTIHAAKGLEWDVVIVPGLHLMSGNNRGPLLSSVDLDSSDEQSAHFLLAPIPGRGEDSHQLNKWIASIRQAREIAENKRLFYVVCTRAREELHLFAAPTLSSTGEIKPSRATLLDAAWPAAEPFFMDAFAASQSKPASNLVAFPAPAAEPGILDIAAQADTVPEAPQRPANLQRLPLAFDPATRFANARPLPSGTRDDTPAPPHFKRPEGSVAARAFGNTVHALLERITLDLAAALPASASAAASTILASLPAWNSRAAALLRSEGLPPASVERLAHRALHALELTLKDPTGLWLLSPHPSAATEYALTAAHSDQATEIRIDRLFRAGPEPLAPGSTHLWIVDYKTTTHGPEGLDAFLTQEHLKYAPQLASYAATLAQTEPSTPIRLALYYPLLTKLLWWPSP